MRTLTRQLFKLTVAVVVILWLMSRSEAVSAMLLSPYTLGLGIASSVELQRIHAALARQAQLEGRPVSPDRFQAYLREAFTAPRGDPTLDHWGNPYGYRVRADGQAFEVWSNGPDGAPGTDDDIRARWERV